MACKNAAARREFGRCVGEPQGTGGKGQLFVCRHQGMGSRGHFSQVFMSTPVILLVLFMIIIYHLFIIIALDQWYANFAAGEGSWYHEVNQKQCWAVD